MKKFMTIEEFCVRYCVSRSTVYRLFERGAVEKVHVGRAVRIDIAEAEAWAESLVRKAA